jgi:hypothetical protein
VTESAAIPASQLPAPPAAATVPDPAGNGGPPEQPTPFQPEQVRVTDDGVLDFAPETEPTPVRFRIGERDPEDYFTAAPGLPVGVAFDFVRLSAAIGPNPADRDQRLQEMQAAMDLFEKVLYPEDFPRFKRRMYDVRRPIDPPMLYRVIQGLMGRYGMRPTPPSAASSGTPPSPAAGTSSTGAPPSPASTSNASPSTGSATSPTPTSSPA